MWISRARYEELVRAEAAANAHGAQVVALLKQVEDERKRAENAIDMLLLHQGAVPITPQAPPKPEPPMFDDDPEVLAEMMKQYAANPVETLMTEGKGDAQ